MISSGAAVAGRSREGVLVRDGANGWPPKDGIVLQTLRNTQENHKSNAGLSKLMPGLQRKMIARNLNSSRGGAATEVAAMS